MSENMMPNKFTLKSVRLSFPSLWRKAKFNGEETKFEATFLLDKATNAELVKKIQSRIAELIKTDLKGAKLGADKLCLRDGADTGYDGYENAFSLKASNNKRPLVIDRDKSQLEEEDGRPYSGCYVNAVIELWVQQNEYGKRINASLLGVQFAKDGESFAGGASGSASDFDDLGEDDEANPFA